MELLIAQLYALCGLVSVIGYMPQIQNLLNCRESPNDISIKSWTIWNFDAFVALLYGVVCLKDTLFCSLVVVDILMMCYIIALVMHRRYVQSGVCRNLFHASVQYYLCRPFFAIAVCEKQNNRR